MFFYHHAWQNTYYYLTGENVFNLDTNTNSVLAKYNFDDNYEYVLLIEYQHEDEASSGYTGFMNSFFSELPQQKIIELDDKKWITCLQKSNHIICIFCSKTEADVEKLEQLFDESL